MSSSSTIKRRRSAPPADNGQSLLWPEATPKAPASLKIKARSGTFTDNLKLPVHRWFKYSAGFSAEWVSSVLREHGAKSVFDPFAGSGTTLLAADSIALASQGAEGHPFVARIAEAKLSWKSATPDLLSAFIELRGFAVTMPAPIARDPESLIARIYTPETLESLDRIRLAFVRLSDRWPKNHARLLWLAITGLLRECSHVGTAQWQYVLPKKMKSSAKIRDPWIVLETAIRRMIADAEFVQIAGWSSQAKVTQHDSRQPFEFFEPQKFDAIITSPPYPNNYDYADATRLEMSFWGEIETWGDLQTKVRRHLMRSCSQHAAAERLKLEQLLSATELDPIRDELMQSCHRLAEIRETKGGKKTYHTMAAAYFSDLAKVFQNLRPITAKGAVVCFVIGDSAPYGIHLPAERWLGELAIAAGFKSWRFEKLRDRNIKWDNRVHDIPLHEGNLWIES